MKLIVASMMRNEAGRFLRPVLDIWSQFADDAVVLDDGSEDETAQICKDSGAYVAERSVYEARAWGGETPARQTLFELAWGFACIDDWIMFLDADMIPARSPRVFMSLEADAVAFVLYDLWGDGMYREDDFWRGHRAPRVWMIRKRRDHDPWEWSGRGIHAGHLPLNAAPERIAFAPPDYGLLHYAYITPVLREEKYARYMSVAAQMDEHERLHAASIIDPSPNLRVLDFEPEFAL